MRPGYLSPCGPFSSSVVSQLVVVRSCRGVCGVRVLGRIRIVSYGGREIAFDARAFMPLSLRLPSNYEECAEGLKFVRRVGDVECNVYCKQLNALARDRGSVTNFSDD